MLQCLSVTISSHSKLPNHTRFSSEDKLFLNSEGDPDDGPVSD